MIAIPLNCTIEPVAGLEHSFPQINSGQRHEQAGKKELIQYLYVLTSAGGGGGMRVLGELRLLVPQQCTCQPTSGTFSFNEASPK